MRVLPVLPTAVDVTLLTADAHLFGWSLRDNSSAAATEVEGSVTSPAALATIVTTPSLHAGIYTVKWEVELAGTLAAGDSNNMELTLNGVAQTVAVFPAVAGTYPQGDVQLTVPSLGTVAVKAIAAGTVGAIYSATISLIPVSTVDTILELQDGNNPLGEISLATNATDNRWFGPQGLHVRNQLLLHVVQGSVTGAVYAKFIRP